LSSAFLSTSLFLHFYNSSSFREAIFAFFNILSLIILWIGYVIS
jgi:hypothetical protein